MIKYIFLIVHTCIVHASTACSRLQDRSKKDEKESNRLIDSFMHQCYRQIVPIFVAEIGVPNRNLSPVTMNIDSSMLIAAE